jgi:hypothetical protein
MDDATVTQWMMVSVKNVLCDEELVTSTELVSLWLLMLSLRSGFKEPHLFVIRWSEDLFFLCIACQLPWEYFLLDVGIGTDFRNLECNTLIHQLSVEILTLDLLLSAIVTP